VRRKIVFSLAALCLIVGLVVFGYHRLAAQGNAGYVIIGLDRWVLETSLYVTAVTLVAAFILLYGLIRLVTRTLRLPTALKQRGSAQRSKRSQDALIAGLLETAEGNWEKAERNLIRHAADSGIPLINYLTAARAAHSRGAHEQRDEYLKLAHESTPKAELAVGLTRAELQLSTRQFKEALESLTHLNRIAPSHAAVLRLMHQAYAQMEDWESLQRLIPALHSNKVLMEAEIKLLETETYSALLKRKSEAGDPAALRELWGHIPQHIRELTGIETLYCAAMIEAGAGAEVEETLRLALGRDWNETLLVLYGCIQMADTERQIHHAETWLTLHPRDAVLLRVLGKLALRIGQREKAENYLQRSLDAEPSVEAYRLMGDLLFEQKDYAAASRYYRGGLMCASHEVVAQIDQNPDGEPDFAEPEETTAMAEAEA
jgi:HemY protein